MQVVPAVTEEEPETELAQVLPFEVFAQAERVGEVMRTDLDARLADLVRGDRQRVPLAFEHGDRKLRLALSELQRQGQAGETAAEDQDVGVWIHWRLFGRIVAMRGVKASTRCSDHRPVEPACLQEPLQRRPGAICHRRRVFMPRGRRRS